MAVNPSPWHCSRCFNFNAFVRPVCDWCQEPKTILEEERAKVLEQQKAKSLAHLEISKIYGALAAGDTVTIEITRSPSETLDEIASKFGHHFDDINPEEFVENLRSD